MFLSINLYKYRRKKKSRALLDIVNICYEKIKKVGLILLCPWMQQPHLWPVYSSYRVKSIQCQESDEFVVFQTAYIAYKGRVQRKMILKNWNLTFIKAKKHFHSTIIYAQHNSTAKDEKLLFPLNQHRRFSFLYNVPLNYQTN